MADRTYYEYYGIEETATQEEIKQTYRRLAKKYHPDANKDKPDAAEIFKKVNEIYEVLSDEDKRAEYDKTIVKYVSKLRAPCTDLDGDGIYLDDYDTLVEEITLDDGGGDIVVEVPIFPAEAFTGAVKEVKINRKETCDACGGSGTKQAGPCDICDQTGKIKFYLDTERGIETFVRVCKTCHGTGIRAVKLCPKCGGKGMVYVPKAFKLPIPKNVRIGSTMLKKGDGHKCRGQAGSGDLKFVIRMAKIVKK